MEPEGSLPDSWVPPTCPYPEPAQSSQYPHIPLPEYPSQYYPPIYAWVSQVVSFPQVSPTKPYIHLSSSSIHATCLTHLTLLNFITQTIMGEGYRSLSSSLCSFLHSPCYIIPFRPKYPPQHHTLKHSQPMFLPQCEQPTFTPHTKQQAKL